MYGSQWCLSTDYEETFHTSSIFYNLIGYSHRHLYNATLIAATLRFWRKQSDDLFEHPVRFVFFSLFKQNGNRCSR